MTHEAQGNVHIVHVPETSKYPESQGQVLSVKVLWSPLHAVQWVAAVEHSEHGRVHYVQVLTVEEKYPKLH